jgi:hypothetical protein
VWIEPVTAADETKNRRGKKKKVDRKIYITEQLPIDHQHFLRVMASFLVESFDIDEDAGAAAAELLGLPSSDGGFCKGGIHHKHTPPPKDGPREDDKKKSATSSSSSSSHGATTRGSKGEQGANASIALPMLKLLEVPSFKLQTVLSATLGRERRGKVLGTEWHGVPIAVKMVHTDDGMDGKYARDLFHSEVEAYRMAGSTGLWGGSCSWATFFC